MRFPGGPRATYGEVEVEEEESLFRADAVN